MQPTPRPPDRPFEGDFLAEVADLGRLRVAWSHTRAAHGAPGVDRVSVERFLPRAEEAIVEMQQRVRSGRYRPPPLRRTLTPKGDGSYRVVGIPTVADRIVQGAAALALHDRIAASFSDASFAYRPGLGPKRAAERLAAILRPDSWAVIADIERFFDTVDHGRLLALLREHGMDARGLATIEAWLRAPVRDRGLTLLPVKGLPQGGPLSPGLANFYLTGFDRALEERGARHVRFADDFVIVTDSEAEARDMLGFLADWLRRHRLLALKPAKTLYTPAVQGFTFVGFAFTGSTRRLPAAKEQTFKERINTLFSVTGTVELGEVVRRHNDLVRGWRHYYGNVSAALDEQLVALDEWRVATTDAYWRSVQLDERLGRATLESLRHYPEHRTERPIDYPDWPHSQDHPQEIPGEDPDPWQLVHWPSTLPPRAVFSKAAALRSHAIAERQLPRLTADRALHVATHGSFLTRRKGLLVIRRKKQPIFECTQRDVRHLTISGQGVALSSTALIGLARHRVSVVLASENGAPIARIVPVRAGRRTQLLLAQLRARHDERGAAVARALVIAKTRNQRALLLYHGKYPRRDATVRAAITASAARIAAEANAASRMHPTDLLASRRPLFLAEARAAAHYWSAVARLLPADWSFPGRRGRGARDPMNALLNYGYALLLSRVWWAIERQDLHPYLGVLHTSRRERPGLVFDLMEEFRQPLVDRAILGMIGRGTAVALREDGRVSLRTRRRLEAAVQRGLERRLRRRAGATLGDAIFAQARAVRWALLDGRPYRAHRMPW
ncbi:MAG: CRISPR-associated endonuclease Cas1 [Deltaproteobacteria bacterium]|nr:CRISPR-associated endonuclease Cas1 [Deltaproteobacteria bacterium]